MGSSPQLHEAPPIAGLQSHPGDRILSLSPPLSLSVGLSAARLSHGHELAAADAAITSHSRQGEGLKRRAELPTCHFSPPWEKILPRISTQQFLTTFFGGGVGGGVTEPLGSAREAESIAL